MDVVLQSRPPEYGPGRFHPKAASGHGCITVLLLRSVEIGGITEVAALRVDDVLDKDGNVRNEIRLDAAQTKGNRGRVVVVGDKLRKELVKYLSVHAPANPEYKLFYTQKRMREGFNANTLTQHFHHLYRAVGIEGASSHSGRRSFITNLASKGVGVKVLMTLAGHRHIGTTQAYIDVNANQLRAAVELV